MQFQLDVVLLKAVLQVHEKVLSREKTFSRDHASTAEVNLRKEIMQDLKWKERKVWAFIINLGTLAHIICYARMYTLPLFQPMHYRYSGSRIGNGSQNA